MRRKRISSRRKKSRLKMDEEEGDVEEAQEEARILVIHVVE